MVEETDWVFDRRSGRAERCFVVAEAGVNHNGDFELAKQLVDTAVEAGANAVKFQTFDADELLTSEAEKASYQQEATDDEETQYEMLKRLELGASKQRRLAEYARERGIVFLSTPFDGESATFLDQLGVPFFKIGSGELTNTPFLRHVAELGRPMLVSTGMSWIGEVENAVRAIEEAGNDRLALLHCVSQYPAPVEAVNLRAMDTLERAFGYPVGFSDHTMGIDIPVAAVARGARIVEKHFTLDRSMEGPDHEASLEPDELARMVEGVRRVEKALGDGRKRPTGDEGEVAEAARKSIVTTREISAGERLDLDALAIRRPGTGLTPDLLNRVEGLTAAQDIDSDTPLKWSHLE